MVKRVVDIDETVGSIPTKPTKQDFANFWKQTERFARRACGRGSQGMKP